MSTQEETTADATEADDEAERNARTAAASDPGIDDASDLDRDELTAVVEELRAENRRLREEYARARRSEYRRSAVALAVLGIVGVAGGVLFPVAREVLLVLGAVGLFGGVLTWYLTPERFVTATVGQSVYEAVAETGAALRDELGLADPSVYVPVDRDGESGVPVRLFVPQSPGYDLPDDEALSSLFVLPDSADRRGIAVRPTAARLVREFEQATTEPVADDPGTLVTQVGDAVVEQFELVDAADPEVHADDRRATVAIRGGVYDDATGFDQPVASFFGTAFALGLDRPVSVEVADADDRTLVTCEW
ncbi:hypothetical protein [Halobellus ruber]|uniref:hypothetical protein n=1 Tax=Halobellus ruber TaxID=2761102 RepID=UPI001C89C42B|nr:hypothetical protein [Halobellus ruber]